MHCLRIHIHACSSTLDEVSSLFPWLWIRNCVYFLDISDVCRRNRDDVSVRATGINWNNYLSSVMKEVLKRRVYIQDAGNSVSKKSLGKLEVPLLLLCLAL